jgi:hypothetical protein
MRTRRAVIALSLLAPVGSAVGGMAPAAASPPLPIQAPAPQPAPAEPAAPVAPAIPAPAEPAAPAPDALALLAQLDDDDYATRERAGRVLASDPGLTLVDLERLIQRTGLSAEQHARLLMAARDRFIRSPRPALGVQFDNTRADRTVVSQVFPRFPAAAVLKPNDEIVAIDGRRLTGGWSEVRPRIISRDPGENLRLEIVRDGERLSIDAPLGRYSDLPQARFLTITDITDAWMVRSGAYPPPPNTAPILAEPDTQWTAAGVNAVDAEWRRRYEIDDQRASILPGGQRGGPLVGADPVNLAQAQWDAERLRNNAAFVPPVRPGNPIVRARQEMMDLRRNELQRQLQIRDEWQARLAEAEARLGGPGLDDGARRELQQRMMAIQNQLAAIERQIEDSRRRLADPPVRVLP